MPQVAHGTRARGQGWIKMTGIENNVVMDGLVEHSTSQIIHIECLPVGLPTSQSGIEYVHESGKEAAPEVAKDLLYAFVNNLGQSTTANAPPAFASLKLTTEDKDQASAVSDELKRIGVRPLELCTITLSNRENSISD